MVDRLNMLMESRIHGDVYVRFEGELLETYRSNMTRRRVLSLRLQSQYLFIFAGGLLGTFVVFIVIYLAGINQWVCIFTGLVLAFVVVWLTFSLNRKFGRFGLMKVQATRTFPRRIINRRSIPRLFTYKRKGAA
jgi:Domain of unknown function (DUF4133)